MQGHRDVGQRVAERAQGGDHHGPLGPSAQAEQPGRDRSRALDGQDRAPDRGAAEVGPAQDRAQQHPGRPGDQVEEGELHGACAQPGPGPEVRPALGQVGSQGRASRRLRSVSSCEPRRLARLARLACLARLARLSRLACLARLARLIGPDCLSRLSRAARLAGLASRADRGPGRADRDAGQAEQAEGQHADGVRRGVRGHHHGRPGQGDQDSAQRGARDPGRRVGQPVQRVRVDELIPRRDLDRQRVQGRGEERGAHAPEPGERDEQPQRRPPESQRDRERGLRGAAEHVRGEHHPASPEPVGNRPGQRQQHHLRDDVGREHQSQAGRAEPAVQHCPGDRHRGHRRTEQGGHEAGVEAPEVPLPQHADPAPQPL